MQINPLAAAVTGHIDQTGERVRHADQGGSRARKAAAVEMADPRAPSGTQASSISSLAHSSAEEFFALAEAGKVNANAPRGTYLNLLV